jgi:hypothetical protein
MKKFVLSFVLLFILYPTKSFSQQYYHEFEDREVYIELNAHKQNIYTLTTVAKENDNCTGFAQVVDLKGNKILFPGGTVWKANKYENGIEISFPNKDNPVRYKAVKANPIVECSLKRDKGI